MGNNEKHNAVDEMIRHQRKKYELHETAMDGGKVDVVEDPWEEQVWFEESAVVQQNVRQIFQTKENSQIVL